MKSIILIFLFSVIISGCASANKVYTSTGEQGYSINCSGTALNWGMCYEKAGEICGEKGYEVLERIGDQGSMLSANQFGLYGGSTISRSLIVKCKE